MACENCNCECEDCTCQKDGGCVDCGCGEKDASNQE